LITESSFLRSVAATVIPSVAVPLSIVGTFGVMYLLGYSLNNLTLMALTISTGFVVDDAIVMIENITRYIEEGESALEAALKGSAAVFTQTFSVLFHGFRKARYFPSGESCAAAISGFPKSNSRSIKGGSPWLDGGPLWAASANTNRRDRTRAWVVIENFL